MDDWKIEIRGHGPNRNEECPGDIDRKIYDVLRIIGEYHMIESATLIFDDERRNVALKDEKVGECFKCQCELIEETAELEGDVYFCRECVKRFR